MPSKIDIAYSWYRLGSRAANTVCYNGLRALYGQFGMANLDRPRLEGSHGTYLLKCVEVWNSSLYAQANVMPLAAVVTRWKPGRATAREILIKRMIEKGFIRP